MEQAGKNAAKLPSDDAKNNLYFEGNPLSPTQKQMQDRANEYFGDTIAKDISAGIDEVIAQNEKEANDALGNKGQRTRLYTSMYNPDGDVRRKNQMTDPEKVQNALINKLRRGTVAILENRKEEIAREASAMGMTVEEYARKMIVPSLESELKSQFDQKQIDKYLPKGATEYILGGISGWIGSGLLDIANKTKAQRRYEQQAQQMTEEGENPYYKPGKAATFGRAALEFADPTFGVAFKGGALVGKAIVKRAEIAALKGLASGYETALGRAAMEKLTPYLARTAETVSQYGTRYQMLANRIMLANIGVGGGKLGVAKGMAARTLAKLPEEILGQGLGMNFYGAMQAGVQATVDADADLLSVGKVMWDSMTDRHGFASAAGFAVVTPWLNEMIGRVGWKTGATTAQKWAGRGKKLLAEVGGIGGTGFAMALGGEINDYFDGKGFDLTVNGLIHESVMAAAMKINPTTLPRLWQSAKRFGASHTDPIQLTADEKKALLEATGTDKVYEALASMFPDRMETDPESKATDQEVAQAQARFLEVMNKLPWDVKNKIMAGLTGSFTLSRPRLNSFAFNGERVVELDKDGNVLSEASFKDAKEKAAYIQQKVMSERENDLRFDLQTLEMKAREEGDSNGEYDFSKAPSADMLMALSQIYDQSFILDNYEKIIKKDPMHRTPEEQIFADVVREIAFELANPKGEVHVEASERKGQDVANDAEVGTDHPDAEKVAQLNAETTEAEQTFAEALRDAEWKDDYNRLKQEGKTDEEIYQALSEGGYNPAELAPLADFIDAQKAQDAFLNQAVANIDQTVSERMNALRQGGREGVQHLIGPNGEDIVLLSGDYTRNPDGTIKANDLVIAIGADGKPHPIDVNGMREGVAESFEDYEARYRGELEALNEKVIDPEGKLSGANAEPQQSETSTPVAEEQKAQNGESKNDDAVARIEEATGHNIKKHMPLRLSAYDKTTNTVGGVLTREEEAAKLNLIKKVLAQKPDISNEQLLSFLKNIGVTMHVNDLTLLYRAKEAIRDGKMSLDELDAMFTGKLPENKEVLGNLGNSTKWKLSEQKAQNGENFISDADGNIDLAHISDDVFDAIGYTKAPLRLTPSMIKHVRLQHGRETNITTDEEAINFVTDVMQNFDHVRLGDNGALIFSIENGRDRTGKRAITILLGSESGDYYGIKTSGYEGIERLKKRPLLWEGGAKESSIDAASTTVTSRDAQQGSEQSGSASVQSEGSGGKGTENIPNVQENSQENIPLDKDGERDYRKATPEAAAKGMAEEFGDSAEQVIVNEGANAEKALEKAKNKPVGDAKATRKRNAAIAEAQADVDHWRAVLDAHNENKRKAAEEAQKQTEEVRKATEEARRKADEEANRRAEEERQAKIQEQEEQGKIPDIVNDTPADARARGFIKVNGEKIERQGEQNAVEGRESTAKFGKGDGDTKKGKMAVAELDTIQASHYGGQENPLHYFLSEAQPKDRSGEDSKVAAQTNSQSENFDPSLCTGDGAVYQNASPVVNKRHEVIQGNGRMDMLRNVYRNPESAKRYKEYLKEHAAEWGLTAEDIEKMDKPVLVNRLDVTDAEAIRLGQKDAKDLESGGEEVIKPKNVIRGLGDRFKEIVSNLLEGEEDASIAELITENGIKVLKKLQTLGHISQTQLSTAVKDGKLTEEGKRALNNILKETLFDGAPTTLKAQFEALPAAVQKAILATYLRDLRTPEASRILKDYRNGIQAFSDLMQHKPFAKAKTYEEAVSAINEWKKQLSFGQDLQNHEKYDNFALEIAARMKTTKQKALEALFNEYYDLVQGGVPEKGKASQQGFNFDAESEVAATPKEPISKAEAIKKVFNIELKEKENDVQRSNDVVSHNEPRREGGRDSSGATEGTERNQSGGEPADNRGGDKRSGGEGKEHVEAEPKGETSTAETRVGEKVMMSNLGGKFDEWHIAKENEDGTFRLEDGEGNFLESVTDKQIKKYNKEYEKANAETPKEEKPKDKPKTFEEAIAEHEPLKADEIDGLGVNKYVADQLRSAIKKLENGEPLTAIEQGLYINTLNNVRNTEQRGAEDSTDANAAQLAEGDNAGREPGREGEPVGNVDRTAGGEPDAEQLRGQNSEGELRPSAGERGDRHVSGSEPTDDGVSANGVQSGGSRRTGGNGSNVRERGGKETRVSAAPDAPRDEIKSSIAGNKKKAFDALARLKKLKDKPGNDGIIRADITGGLATWIVKQGDRVDWEALGEFGEAVTSLGYDYVRLGVHNFKEWSKKIASDFAETLKDVFDWGDAEVDDYIKEMWNSNYSMNGEEHTIGEWASIIGNERLRKEIHKDLNEKRKLQQEAEKIEVKVGDEENVRATLPYLLPAQQDDVIKTERQFFDETHQDREHGYGKGMMFTNGTGTGKTYTGLGIVKRFVKQGKGRVLIVTPSQEKVNNWINDGQNLGLNIQSLDDAAKKEGTTATKAKGEGVVITTYANMQQNQALLEGVFDLVMYDESHKIMENKKAEETQATRAHYMLTNKTVKHALDRMMANHPLTKQLEKVREIADSIPDIKEIFKYSHLMSPLNDKADVLNKLASLKFGDIELTANDFGSMSEYKEVLDIPQMKGSDTRPTRWGVEYENIVKALRKRVEAETLRLTKAIDEERKRLTPEAEKANKQTKTVFLSATPFNMRENLRYAEGYIFSYPEEDPNTRGGYNHRNPEQAFMEQRFSAGYRWRYGRLENHVSNPEALNNQEVQFSDYLQNDLGTLSTRQIENGYDYSRTFPTVTFEHAERFNSALQDVSRDDRLRPLSQMFYDVFHNYNTSTALFESMKTSLVVPRIKEHLKRGRKVVIFHRRSSVKDGAVQPFQQALSAAAKLAETLPKDSEEKGKILDAIEYFKHKYGDLLEWEKGLDYRLPREQLAEIFGEENVAFFSGKETTKKKHQSVEDFMTDNEGKDIIVVQEASGKEGISLHDKTGEHQRVEIELCLPQSPIAFIQIEGRIYRIGQKSNAIFEYPLLGLDLELNLFASQFNRRLGTTENLAMGSQARNLADSISRGVQENSGDIGFDDLGVGGREYDGNVSASQATGMDRAVQDYYTNQKLKGRRDNREGKDYFPTPEPVGFKMVEWAGLSEGESALEPSAGHGAIARYVPTSNTLKMIEPSTSLMGKLRLNTPGMGRDYVESDFESYSVMNKHDVVLMNPPYGSGGATAVQHVSKAFKHLNEGGRLIAIIPQGPACEKKMDAWLKSEEGKAAVVTGEVLMPQCTFDRAGTGVMTRIVVIDKVSREQTRRDMPDMKRVDLRDVKNVTDLFEAMRDIDMQERTIDKEYQRQKMVKNIMSKLRDNMSVFSVLWHDKESGRVDYEIKGKYGVRFFGKIDPEQVANDKYEALAIFKKLQNGKKYADDEVFPGFVGRGDERVPKVEMVKDSFDNLMELVARLQGTTVDAMERELSKASSAQPMSTEAPKGDRWEYMTLRHTQTGADLHIVKSNGHMTDEQYKEQSARAKQLGGFWDRYSKGFRFPSKEKAEQFMNGGKELMMSEGERDDLSNDTEAKQVVTEFVTETLGGTDGIELVRNTQEEGQKVAEEQNAEFAKKKRALETASLQGNEDQPTVVSSADGAKVIQNLRTTKEKLQKLSNQSKTFLGDVASALGAKRHNSSSEYATFETKNGRVVTIRLANHNAAVSTFDKHNENEGISIVISPKKNEGLTVDGDAHVIEYFYDSIKLRRAEGKPLAEIVASIEQSLYSGEFKDTTGLAERQEVNGESELKTSNGTVYGWAEGNKVHLTPEGLNPNTPIHEYTHLWAKAIQKKAPELWKNVKALLKDNPLVKEILGEKGYEGLSEDGLYSEVLSRVSGKNNAGKLEEAAQRLLDQGHSQGKVKQMLSDFKEAVKKAWSWIGKELFGIEKFDSVEEITDRVLYDLINKTNLELDANERGETEFQFYGKRGANDEQKRTNKIAEDMEKRGEDAARIKIATGWERGADGKWRYEMPDGDFSENFNWKSGKLGDLWKDDALFMAYPGLADYKLKVISRAKYEGGYHDVSSKTIGINKNYGYAEDRRLVVLHEIQHAIQAIEGFARGANPKTSKFEKLRAEIEQYIEKNEGDLLKALKHPSSNSSGEAWYIMKSIAGARRKLTKEQALEILDDIINKGPEMGYDEHWRHAGEVEARNVMERANLYYEDRKNMPAERTEDVPREEQIVVADGNDGISAEQTRFREDDVENPSNNLSEDKKDVSLHSNAIFEGLKNLKDKVDEYNEKVKVLVRRVVQGRSSLRGEFKDAEPGTCSEIQLAAATIAADRRGVPQAGRKVKEAERGTKVELEQSIEDYAKANDAWFDEAEIAKNSNGSENGEAWAEGGENRVYLSKDGKTVTKVLEPYERNQNSMYVALRNIKLFNELFPHAPIKVTGFLRDADGKFRIVTEQPFVDGEVLTREEYEKLGVADKVRKYFEEMGLEDVYDDAIEFKNDKYYVRDIHYGNIILDKDGEPSIIDANVTLHKTYETALRKEGFGFEDVEAEPTRFREGKEERTTPSDKIREHVERLSKKLGKDIEVVDDVEKITNEDAKKAIKAGRNVKGWWDSKGAHIYMPNIKSKADAEATILHERVGHQGMREILGENYQTYLRNLWENKNNPYFKELHDYVRENMPRKGWDLYETIDEWAARKAEADITPENLRDWNHIKTYLSNALRKAGYEFEPNINDVRYTLWMAKNHAGKSKGNLLWKLRKSAFEDELRRANYKPEVKDGKWVDTEGYPEEQEAENVEQTQFREDDVNETEKQSEKKLKNTSSQDLFINLQNKKGKKRYDTVTELAERTHNGNLRISRYPKGFERGFESVSHSAATIIALDAARSMEQIRTETIAKWRAQQRREDAGYIGKISEEETPLWDNEIGEREVVKRTLEWAKQNGCLFRGGEFDEKYPVENRLGGETAEADVFLSKDGKSVLKLIRNNAIFDTTLEKLEEIAYENLVFPGASRKVIGFMEGEFPEDMYIVVEQPYVKGKTVLEKFGGDEYAAQDYISKYMQSLGYREAKVRYEDSIFDELEFPVYYNETRLVEDVNMGNLIIGDNGEHVIIDAKVTKHDGRLKKFGVPVSKGAFGEVGFEDSKRGFKTPSHVRFREEDDENLTPDGKSVRERINDRIGTARYYWTEAYVDKMVSLRIAQEEIIGKGKEVKDSENAYIAQNNMDSIIEPQFKKFEANQWEKLDDVFNACVGLLGGKPSETADAIEQHLIKKSGLERNRVFYVRDAIKALLKDKETKEHGEELANDWQAELQDGMFLLKKGEITYREYIERLDDFIRENIKEDYDPNKNDKSGISSFYGMKDGEFDESLILDDVENMERALGDKESELWDNIKECTQYGLDYAYKVGGMMTEATHDYVSNMMNFYVPMRGFNEATMEDMYGYVTGGSSDAASILKRANGRTSLADSPIAYIKAMAYQAIKQAEQNRVNQKFYRMAVNHPSDAVVVSQVWRVKDGTNPDGSERWVNKVAEYSENDAPEVITKKIAAFEAEMKEKQAKGEAEIVRDRAKFEAGFEADKHKTEHTVNVFLNGKMVQVTVTGNPRVAQALNGQIRNKEQGTMAKVKNMMSNFATSLSPEFILSNTSRDSFFANVNIATKENAAYYKRFIKNQAKAYGLLTTDMFKKWEQGKLADYGVEKLFGEFMDNGGKTGKVAQKRIRELEKEFKNELKLQKGSTTFDVTKKFAKKAFGILPSFIEAANERAELINRFATYRTSREMGRSIMRSVHDAKEVSVNFNTKGAGNGTKAVASNGEVSIAQWLAGYTAGKLRGGFMFFNAGMQAANGLYKNVKNHPLKTIGYMGAIPTIGGLMAPALMNAIGVVLGADDDAYEKIPVWERRNNICIPTGKGYIKFALPHELRAWWGLGDIAASYIYAPKMRSPEELPLEITEQMAGLMPINFLEGGVTSAAPQKRGLALLGNFVPDPLSPWYEYMINLDWTGKPIHRENKFGKGQPEYMNAYSSSNQGIVELVKWVHNQTREGKGITNPDTDATGIGAKIDPTFVEHILKSYFGGMWSISGKAYNSYKTFGTDDFKWSKAPMISRIWGDIDDRALDATQNAKYWNYVNEAKKMESAMRDKVNRMNPTAIDFLNNSPEGKRYNIWKQYDKRIKGYRTLIDKAPESSKGMYEGYLNDAVREMVEAMDKVK